MMKEFVEPLRIAQAILCNRAGSFRLCFDQTLWCQIEQFTQPPIGHNVLTIRPTHQNPIVGSLQQGMKQGAFIFPELRIQSDIFW